VTVTTEAQHLEDYRQRLESYFAQYVQQNFQGGYVVSVNADEHSVTVTLNIPHHYNLTEPEPAPSPFVVTPTPLETVQAAPVAAATYEPGVPPGALNEQDVPSTRYAETRRVLSEGGARILELSLAGFTICTAGCSYWSGGSHGPQCITSGTAAILPQ
jgi:hypothetical protein